MRITVEISPGELLDKLTILEIKGARMDDPAQLENVRREMAVLAAAAARHIGATDEIAALRRELKAVNEQLWEIEDKIRDREREQDFGAVFVELARGVYLSNDRRASLKRRINDALGSDIREEKSYAQY